MEHYDVDSITLFIKKILADELKESPENIDEHAHFHEFGLDSINSVYLLDQVEAKYNISLTPLYFWDYPSLHLFAQQLSEELQK